MRDHTIVIYDDKRPSEEGELWKFAILPAFGAAVMWTYWLQQEFIRVWSHPLDNLAYTVLITVLALVVLAATLAIVLTIIAVIFYAVISVLKFTTMMVRGVYRVFSSILTKVLGR